MSVVLNKLPNPPIPCPRGRVYPPPSPDRETHPSLFSHVILRSLPSVVLFFAVREAKRSPKDAKRRQEAPRERQRDAKMGQRARQGGPKGDQGRPREAKRRPRGGQERPKRGQRAAKGRPREAKGKPKGCQSEAKGRPREPKGGQSSPKPKKDLGNPFFENLFWSDFEGKIVPKASQSRKSDFLKTELSFESGAHFQREGQARPGQKGLAKPSLARTRLSSPGGEPGRNATPAFGGGRGSPAP